jgi:hypothetical protein
VEWFGVFHFVPEMSTLICSIPKIPLLAKRCKKWWSVEEMGINLNLQCIDRENRPGIAGNEMPLFVGASSNPGNGFSAYLSRHKGYLL